MKMIITTLICLLSYSPILLGIESTKVKTMVLIWDNDGTIQASKDPNDKTKAILPNVKETMDSDNVINIICSGCKTGESEKQNYDALQVIDRFKQLMNTLPISIATFSPAIGGTQCYVIIKRKHSFEIRKAHENSRYKNLIGTFKKPGTGMLVVIRDLLIEMGYSISDNITFIGDSWHDKQAAQDFGIAFLNAKEIHKEGNICLKKQIALDTFCYAKNSG